MANVGALRRAVTMEDRVGADFAALRRVMVDGQLRTYDVTDPDVNAAFEAVERERFVPEARRDVAYVDQPVVFPSGRAMLAPMALARLLQALDIGPSSHVLDLACATGYSTALLLRLASSVVAVESDASLAATARDLLRAAGSRVTVVEGPIGKGAPDHGPFDAILVNGACAVEPSGLFAQLKDGGRLAVVLGEGRSGRATIYRKTSGRVAGAAVFDASAKLLPEFAKAAEFVF
jgi:protein-L-isoaspartate(D-aspartate) O-methyltransferase